ncbi:hypothetical protein [Xylella fastidiosa]|nr:hypothetical protein [Xylella fastidiosa]ERI60475.1 hypothetical protein M233_03875 [Xylella fastidiosa subsp. multiplex Griffin-1]MDG4871859.1 hypothetical protein [Xylella fastidiosa subsp. multiplex]
MACSSVYALEKETLWKQRGERVSQHNARDWQLLLVTCLADMNI